MTQGLNLLIFDIFIPNTGLSRKGKENVENCTFYDHLQVAHIHFNHILLDKTQHMAPNHLQGIPGNVVSPCVQEKQMEFINIGKVTQRKKIN